MPSRKIYCPGCGSQIVLDVQEESARCKKCRITIHLPVEWFSPKEKKGPVTPFKPAFRVEVTPEPGVTPSSEVEAGSEEGSTSEPSVLEIKPEGQSSDVEPSPDLCPRCRARMPTPIPFQCSVCGQNFCLRCPGRHIPPGQKTMVALVKYKYRFRGASQWKNEQIRFKHDLPLVVCPACYESEFNKGIKKLEMDIRNWYQELVQDEDAKIIEKVMPEMCPIIPGTGGG